MNRYSEKLFNVNLQKGTLEINKKEVRIIPEFRTILERDKGGKIIGDPDGRKKYLACAEFIYIYVLYDNFTMYSKLDFKERERQALEVSKLIDVDKWKVDKDLKLAIKKYKEITLLSPLSLALVNAEKALHSIGKDISMFEKYNNKLRKEIQRAEVKLEDYNTAEEDKDEARQRVKVLIQDLSSNNKEILNLSESLNTRYKTIEDLRNKVSDEDNKLQMVIGNRTVHNRENPK